MSEKERTSPKLPEKFVVTISFDEETAAIFRDLKKGPGISQSELMRTALKFYSRHKALFESVDVEKIYIYSEMLSDGEHVILDMDHWILFLNFIESHPDNEKFWEMHKRVSQAHAEEFIHKNHDVGVVLKRLEACNLFKLSKVSENDFTLILGYDVPKKFIRTELEDIFSKMGRRAEIREDLSKMRVKITPPG
ncbi:MAG TPA: ribbon-helix-helix protein, CopG family [Methanothrix sp.]|nr:ribbon-helix-helix protein, CopG family [Methanothrix sp.]